MFNNNFDFITDWTVQAVNFVYRLLVQNTYFILSNSLFLLLLIFLRLTMNNFLFFIIPIFFLLVSFSAQFKSISESEDTVSFRHYFSIYKNILKNGWPTFLLYTCLIVFIVFDLRILFVANLKAMMYPVVITGCFLLSSMFFVLLITTDERAKTISLRRKITWSLSISYRLPLVTLLNFLYVVLIVFFLQNYSLAYLCFFGGAINYYIHSNLNRRFSLDLFFEQMNHDNSRQDVSAEHEES